MAIFELRNETSEGGQRVVHVEVDGTGYLFIAPAHGKYITIIHGQWIGNARSLGKTFHRMSGMYGLNGKYKKHGQVVAEYAKQLAPNMGE